MPDKDQLQFGDLLDPDRPPVIVTDIGLSHSCDRAPSALALFCRLVTLRGTTMTSGFSLAFRAMVRDVG